MEKVVITHLTSDHPAEEVFKIVKRSRALINTICEYSKQLKKEGVEVYERNVNIIRTSQGYYCAFFESDIKKNRKKEESFPKPFKGLDGRMKVTLKDKEGEKVVEDLAMLVARTFIENPHDYEYVKFHDGNAENCKAENLYWSETK